MGKKIHEKRRLIGYYIEPRTRKYTVSLPWVKMNDDKSVLIYRQKIVKVTIMI